MSGPSNCHGPFRRMEACDLASAAMNIPDTVPLLQTAKVLPKCKLSPPRQSFCNFQFAFCNVPWWPGADVAAPGFTASTGDMSQPSTGTMTRLTIPADSSFGFRHSFGLGYIGLRIAPPGRSWANR